MSEFDAPVAGRSLPERSTPTRASLAPRLGALLYEALLLIAMAFVVGFALLPLISPAGTADRTTLTVPPLFARTMLFCVLAGGAAWYYLWSWSDGRRTLPQKTWRLRLVEAQGRDLTRRTALVRYVAGWIGPSIALAVDAAMQPRGSARFAALLLGLNYAWAVFDRDRQFLHDRIAGTRVVRG